MSKSKEKEKTGRNLDITYPTGYNIEGIEVKETEIFKKWIKTLKDKTARDNKCENLASLLR